MDINSDTIGEDDYDEPGNVKVNNEEIDSILKQQTAENTRDKKMDFLYDLIRIKDFWTYNNYIFSIGTYQANNMYQLVFPLIHPIKPELKSSKLINDTVIIAIDKFYGNTIAHYLKTTYFKDELDFHLLFNIKHRIYVYHNTEHNILLVIICDNLYSSYEPIEEKRPNFSYTISYIPRTKDWFLFERILEKLIEKNKMICINNWANIDTNYFKQINGKNIARSERIGMYFEHFPELGNILYVLNHHKPGAKMYVVVDGDLKTVKSQFKIEE